MHSIQHRAEPSTSKLICVSRLPLHRAHTGVKVDGDGHAHGQTPWIRALLGQAATNCIDS